MKIENISPVVDVTFWKRAYYLKLETLKLSEEPIKVTGFARCSKFTDNRLLVNLETSSFDPQDYKIALNTLHQVFIPGYVQIINTEKKFDEFCEQAQATCNTLAEKNPDSPFNFFMVLFVNHKTFHFTFEVFQVKKLKSYSKAIKSEAGVQEVSFELDKTLIEKTGGLVLGHKTEIPVICDTTSDTAVSPISIDFILGLSKEAQKGFLITRSPVILREDEKTLTVSAKHFHIQGDAFDKTSDVQVHLKSVERQIGLNLKPFLSKQQLVEDQSKLNLKLMKWRLEPLLDLDSLFAQRALILGSGTLGCNIGRLLVGYGIRKLTFLDYGNVSFSNLARQSLFNTDSFNTEGKGLPKAEAACIGIQMIAPHSELKAVNITVPMPGHFITDEQLDSAFKDLMTLESLISSHDIIFNVFDSREARYFPSLISALLNKNIISIGIGYDSYVIVQHGNYGLQKCQDFLKETNPIAEDNGKTLTEVFDQKNAASNYGCFFCSDYMPPSDSISNRTMDQQCTVSRPGVSMIASGVAVELMVNNLHKGKIGKEGHFIRGAAGNAFELVEYENLRFESCVACSTSVIVEYLKDKRQFLKEVLNNPNVIGKFTGFEVDGQIGVSMGENAEDDDGIIVIDFPSFPPSTGKDNETVIKE